MRRRWLWRSLAWGAVACLATAGGVVYLGYAPAGDPGPHPFNHDRNAVWLEHRWLERAQSVEEMETISWKNPVGLFGLS